MDDEKTLRIPARIKAITEACDFVGVVAQAAGLSEKDVHHCQLAVDEACTNIIEHGYPAGDDRQVIDIVCQPTPQSFVIRVLDDSPAYNPLLRENPDPGMSLDSRERGGWGVYFIKQLMDEVSYARLHGRNQLTMVKHHSNARTQPHNIVLIPYKKNTLVLKLNGALDAVTSNMLEAALLQQLNGGNKNLIIDLSGVEAVSSESLKMLVGMWKRARDLRGDIVLAGLTADVREVISLTGFDLVFAIASSVDEALERFKHKTG